MERRQAHGELEHGTSLQICLKSRQGTWPLSPSGMSHWTWMPWEEEGFPLARKHSSVLSCRQPIPPAAGDRSALIVLHM